MLDLQYTTIFTPTPFISLQICAYALCNAESPKKCPQKRSTTKEDETALLVYLSLLVYESIAVCWAHRLPAQIRARLCAPVRLHAGLQPHGRERHTERGAGGGGGLQGSHPDSHQDRDIGEYRHGAQRGGGGANTHHQRGIRRYTHYNLTLTFP